MTLAGHAGGPPLRAGAVAEQVIDAVEAAMDDAGIATAHLAGNSLGGWLALKLAERGRARSVVALAPAGGWASGDESWRDTLAMQADMPSRARASAPHAARFLASRQGRRLATELITERYEHLPVELLVHQLLGIARCDGAAALVAGAREHGWPLEPARITCPVRIVWGTADRLLPWPAAAARYRTDWLPDADWVILDGVGHCPQLDVPLETAQLILGFTAP